MNIITDHKSFFCGLTPRKGQQKKRQEGKKKPPRVPTLQGRKAFAGLIVRPNNTGANRTLSPRVISTIFIPIVHRPFIYHLFIYTVAQHCRSELGNLIISSFINVIGRMTEPLLPCFNCRIRFAFFLFSSPSLASEAWGEEGGKGGGGRGEERNLSETPGRWYMRFYDSDRFPIAPLSLFFFFQGWPILNFLSSPSARKRLGEGKTGGQYGRPTWEAISAAH